MKIFKFRLPFQGFRKDEVERLPIKYQGRSVGKIIDVQETEDGLYVTGQLDDDLVDDPAFKHTLFGTDGQYFLSIHGTVTESMQDYAKADVKLTNRLYPTMYLPPDLEPGHSHKSDTTLGWLMVVLATLIFWFVVYMLIHR